MTEPKHNILIVEDEALTAKDLHCYLGGLGYSMLPTASSCAEAVDVVGLHHPDLVLMDIHLDGPSDGIEAAAVIGLNYNIPVVFMTAFVDADTVERAKQVGPYGYLLKPVRHDELRVVVELAMHKHRVESQLRQRERWFSTTLQSIADAVITVDCRGTVTFMNSVAEFMTGVTAKSAEGKPISDVLHLLPVQNGPSPTALSIDNPLERALRELRVVDMPEARLKNLANGEERLISDSAAPVIANGQLLGAVMVFHDVTESRRLHDQLVISDRMVSVGMLAAGVAHEINNPLTVAVANVDSLSASMIRADGLARNGETSGLLKDAQEALRRIRDIVRDLKLLSRSEQPQPTSVDLKNVLESSLRMASHQIRHRAQIHTDYQPAPRVWAAESRLSQVFLNILLNAADAIPEGHAQTNLISIELCGSDDGEAVVKISDSGTGMSRTTLERLFTPFFTTKPVGTGTGLGLSICQRIVTGFGGTIQIASEVGRGTTVRVGLPGSDRRVELPPPQVTMRATGAGLSRGTILIVDDDEMVGRVVERMLSLDHKTQLATSGKQALSWIQAGARYDVILCDVMMPEMTGIDLYRLLCEFFPEQSKRMIFMTGGCFTERASHFLENCKVPALEKPVDLAALRTAVATQLLGTH
jgi:PAS domain S-box-containing protein